MEASAQLPSPRLFCYSVWDPKEPPTFGAFLSSVKPSRKHSHEVTGMCLLIDPEYNHVESEDYQPSEKPTVFGSALTASTV